MECLHPAWIKGLLLTQHPKECLLTQERIEGWNIPETEALCTVWAEGLPWRATGYNIHIKGMASRTAVN